jgi:hypothetical protein
MDGCKRLTHIHLFMCKDHFHLFFLSAECARSMHLYLQKTFTTPHTYITKSEILF